MIHEPNYRMMYDPQPPYGQMIMFSFLPRERESKRELPKIKGVFETVITTAFQIVFHLKIYQNNIFFIFKNYFQQQHIKYPNIYIYKNLIFKKHDFNSRFQTNTKKKTKEPVFL
jgi:hypothetical protein